MKRILWMGLLILIIPAMVAFYGFGSGGLGNANRMGTAVATITYPDGSTGSIGGTEMRFAKNYLEGQLQRYSREQGIMLDSLAVNDLTNNAALVDQAVNLDILRHYAEQHDLTVSMDEVNAMFQKNSTADQRRMMVQRLAARGRGIESFLEEQRKGRVLQKAAESIGANVRVTYYEAWQNYLNSHESLVFDYVTFKPSDFISSVTVTDAGLKSYYEKNIEDFRIPDQVEYEYVLIRKDDLKSSITLTDDEITSYYTNKKEDFRLPRKVEASQIFLKLPSAQDLNTTSAAALTSITLAVQNKANDLYERAAKGEDFAKLADTFSEEENFPPRADADDNTTATDKKTTAGGNLGLVSEDVAKTWYGDQWTSAVFGLQPGAISRPIRTPKGFTIVQVKKIIEGEIQPQKDVRPIIEKRLRDEKVEPIFESVGAKMEKIAERVTTLQQVAKETSSTIKTSPKVNSDNQYVPGIGLLGDLEEPIHDLKKGGRSDVLTDSQRHLVIQIKQEYPAHNPSLEEIKGRVEQAYKMHMAEEQARKKADELMAKSKSFKAFQKALTDAGTTYTTSRPFTRPEVASIFGGPIENFVQDSAGVKEGEIHKSEIGRQGQQQFFAVWHVDKVTAPSKTEFTRDLAKITQTLEDQKRQVAILEYIRDQRAKIKDNIEVDENYLY